MTPRPEWQNFSCHSTAVPHEGEAPSIPETPHFDPDQGDPSPEEPAVGVATKIESKELVSRLIQGYLDQTGIEACPLHQMDHKIKGNRHLPVFTCDFSGPHPHRVNVAQYLLVCVWSLGHRHLWCYLVCSPPLRISEH